MSAYKWTAGNVTFPTLTAAVIHARYHRLPLTQAGKPVALTSVSDGNGGVLLTARWAR